MLLACCQEVGTRIKARLVKEPEGSSRLADVPCSWLTTAVVFWRAARRLGVARGAMAAESARSGTAAHSSQNLLEMEIGIALAVVGTIARASRVAVPRMDRSSGNRRRSRDRPSPRRRFETAKQPAHLKSGGCRRGRTRAAQEQDQGAGELGVRALDAQWFCRRRDYPA